MAKIILVAEKITDQMAFIKMLKEITNKPLSEIRESIIQKKPFFEGSVYDEDTNPIVQKILKFSKKQGDKIKIFEKISDTPYEITEEIYQNTVKWGEEISKQFEEEDELEALRNEENELS